jgi:alpha-glucosidase (family GH31 glycosyl hydrolase)
MKMQVQDNDYEWYEATKGLNSKEELESVYGVQDYEDNGRITDSSRRDICQAWAEKNLDELEEIGLADKYR